MTFIRDPSSTLGNMKYYLKRIDLHVFRATYTPMQFELSIATHGFCSFIDSATPFNMVQLQLLVDYKSAILTQDGGLCAPRWRAVCVCVCGRSPHTHTHTYHVFVPMQYELSIVLQLHSTSYYYWQVLLLVLLQRCHFRSWRPFWLQAIDPHVISRYMHV